MTTMPRVYVAGKLSAPAVEFIKNIHRMMTAAERVRKAGFAVFVPGIDILLGMRFGDWEYEDYFQNSQPWLDAADAIFVVRNGATSSAGTQREIARAEEAGIPVFTSLHALKKWRDEGAIRL